jgi:CheY-like chemotaxis protein
VTSKSSKKYDFIILDLNMPIMDGYEACEQIVEYYSDDKIIGDKSPCPNSK